MTLEKALREFYGEKRSYLEQRISKFVRKEGLLVFEVKGNTVLCTATVEFDVGGRVFKAARSESE